MKGFNSVQLIGNIGQDIELRHTNSGVGVTTLRLAVSERAKVSGEWTDVTNWFDIVCWGKTAELCAQYLNKGSSVFVIGRLTVRSFEDRAGQKRIKTEVVAEDVKFLGGRQENAAPFSVGSPGAEQAEASPYDNDKLYEDNSGSEFSYD